MEKCCSKLLSINSLLFYSSTPLFSTQHTDNLRFSVQRKEINNDNGPTAQKTHYLDQQLTPIDTVPSHVGSV